VAKQLRQRDVDRALDMIVNPFLGRSNIQDDRVRYALHAGEEELLNYLGANVPTLRHITIFQGGKAYGSDLGPYKTPAREDDLRLMSPNYYYDQEDLLKTRQKRGEWGFTVIRPGGAICGFSVGSAMNLILVIGVHAAICREMGLPLRFPGPQKVYDALYQVTSADILAEATI
jgi:hypothetical protein